MGNEAFRVNARYISALENIGGPNTANSTSHISGWDPRWNAYESEATRDAHWKELENAEKARKEYYDRQKSSGNK